jgi:cysteinyl-tRNA synthetase
MPLVLYNTLTRTQEPFEPIHPDLVRMYVCGPTVYGHSHLGHAKSYISFDIIARYLRYLGFRVLYVQNITDVGHLTDDADEGEDKLIKQSRIDRMHPMQVADFYTRSYYEDMDALNVLRPDIAPRASGHITEQITLVEQLLARGLAYEANGSVYFDVPHYAAYGKLSRRTIEEMNAGTRIEVKSEKRHPADFALWKRAEPGHIMRWPSPWGEGFPGWHLECSAMSMKYLGESFDIHGGGLENQFPHHECEIAQSEGATGKPFVKYWLHNNMVTVDGKKMGKSMGNFITLKDAFSRWTAGVVRFFVLQSHYRSTLDFSAEAVEGAGKGLEKLANTLRNVHSAAATATTGTPSGIDLEKYRQAFVAAMNDDFNTPSAIATLFDLSREVNQALARGTSLPQDELKAIEAFFSKHADEVLGLNVGSTGEQASSASIESGMLALFISMRADLRREKLWGLSDKIRDGLLALGVALEDKKEGTVWKRVESSQ